MAMTKKPGAKPTAKEDKKSAKLPPWLQNKKAPAKGTKGGKAPKSSNPFAKGK